MKAIVDACLNQEINAEVKIVISNNSEAEGLKVAQNHNIQTKYININDFSSKKAYEDELSAILQNYEVDLICLAGYMKLLGAAFIERHKGNIINIHPSLLPAFKGLDAQEQAFNYGVKISGCTVHYVNEEMDGGKIIMQDSVIINDSDTLEDVIQNILKKEHQLYPKAIKWIIEKKRG